ncbi:hypothetical protein M3J09_007172 [Ascochyta lentis]
MSVPSKPIKVIPFFRVLCFQVPISVMNAGNLYKATQVVENMKTISSTALVFILCHVPQLAVFGSNLITSVIVPPRMPHATALVSYPLYGEYITGAHPDNMSTLNSYRREQF